MRLAVVAILAACLALPASAAGLDPSELVIRTTDVPAGFRLDPSESGLRTNALEAKEFPETKPLFRRWGRLTGYQAMFRRDEARIEDRVDVFRSADGADWLLDFVDRHARKTGFKGQRRAAVAIGDGGWMYWMGKSYALVAWRQGRVFAGVFSNGLTRARLLELARVQERRIRAGLH